MRTFYVILTALLGLANALPRDELFPFGVLHGDDLLDIGDDISSDEFQLSTNISFYDNYYRSIFINVNGILSFETDLPVFKSDLILPTRQVKLIAPFHADVDTRLSGNVYYRETQDPSVLNKAETVINLEFSDRQRPFRARAVFIVTWDDVGYYNQQYDQTNTFQVAIASDGRDSYVGFLYPEDGINWIMGQGKYGRQAPDVPAQVGIDGGNNGKSHMLKESGHKEIQNIAMGSNSGVPGMYIFHVGNTRGRDVGVPSTGNRVANQVPADEPTSCAAGSDMCAANARCEDYPGGFCCHCNAPYFGNGKNCLQADLAQRVNGKVYGSINSVAIDEEDLHAYIVTKDGRVYTAISKVLPVIGHSMQSLYSIGGILGWVFAAHTTPKAMNGFSMTGGDLNRTATVSFLGTGEKVEIKQEVVSSDAQGYMRMTTHLKGNIPTIATGAEVVVDGSKEEYRRTSSGVVKSYATHTYLVDNVPFRFSIDQTITFKECAYAPLEGLDTQRLIISRPFVVYGDAEEIVRYATTNKISPAVGGDPCKELDLECDSNADCVPRGSSHKCMCRKGFYGDGLVGRCKDENECALNSHECDENAQCINSEGSYECMCNDGYTGDGKSCSRDESCADLRCDFYANCVYNSENGMPKCECQAGYTGDGIYCERIVFSCNEVDSCDSNAECVYNRETDSYECECTDGFSGDGYYCSDTGELDITCNQCDLNAECTYDVVRLMYRCMCRIGFTGDGRSCSLIDGAEVQQCNVINNCGDNAVCKYNERSYGYTCRCRPGYQGDGFICEREECDTADNCDANARCVYDSSVLRYSCMCNPGYTGDGYMCQQAGCKVVDNCDRNARCEYDYNEQRHTCQCETGYEGDGTYCREKVVDCNSNNNCDLNADCLYDPTTGNYQCQCRAGYNGDGFSCRVTDCRRDPTMCDPNASCLPQGIDNVCSCNEGYEGNGFACEASGSGSSFLIMAQGMNIMDMPFNPTQANQGKPAMYIPGQTAIGVDVDCASRFFYWTDVSGKTISKARLDGVDSEVIISGLGSPEGVAVDWVGRNMYWTDSGMDRIEISNLDGTNRKILFDDNLVNPRGIVVDPGRGYLFWSDWNREAPKIERSNMDGTDRKILVDTDLELPNGLTIDYEQQRVCWADAGTHMIECMDYNGRGRRVIYDKAGWTFDLVFANNNFYWTDWDQKSLPNIYAYGSSPNAPLALPPGGNGRMYGITAVREECPAGNNACSVNNGGCRFLCLPTPNGGRSCACPDDIDEDECNRIGLLKK